MFCAGPAAEDDFGSGSFYIQSAAALQALFFNGFQNIYFASR